MGAGRSRSSWPRISARSASYRAHSTASGNANRSASGTTPIGRLATAPTWAPSARMFSVLPPPMSKTTNRPTGSPSPRRTPHSVRRASSSPLTTSGVTPVAAATAAANARPLTASRTALVATILTRAAPRRRPRSTYARTTSSVRAAGCSPSLPAAASPSPRRVTCWSWSTTRQGPGAARSATSSRTVLLPTSTVAISRGTASRPAGPGGASRVCALALLLRQRADEVHQLPPLLLGQMLPGRHGAATVRDLPEDLPVRLLLDGVDRPVRGLGRWQRRRRRAVALPASTVAGAAVRFDGFLRVADALDGVLHLIRVE